MLYEFLLMCAIASPNIFTPEKWIPHTDWLGNPAEKHNVSLEDGIMNFSVHDPGQGMKWSLRFDEPVDSAKYPYLVVRYRAEGVSDHGDYFIYLNGREDNNVKEVYAFANSDVDDDGKWRTLTTKIPPLQLDWMAVQVQAKTIDAHIQIKSINFSSEVHKFSITDELDLREYNEDHTHDYEVFILKPIAPYCNADAREKLFKMGLSKKWFKSEKIIVDNIPFQIALDPPNLISTETSAIIPINEYAAEIYLLLGAHYEGDEEPSIGTGKIRKVKHVERFVIEIEYIDQVKDFVFPAQAGSNRYMINSGMGVYYIIPTRKTQIKDIKLHDRMPQGEFYLAGLTISKVASAPDESRVISIHQRKAEKINKPEAPIRISSDGITMDNGYLQAKIDTQNGLTITSLINGYTKASCLKKTSSLFAIKKDKEIIPSSAFKVEKVSTSEQGKVTIFMHYKGINAILNLSFNKLNQLVFSLRLNNTNNTTVKFTPSFLTLDNIFIDINREAEISDPDSLWYCFPRRGSIINNIPISLSDPYSGLFPMQFIDVYSPDLGGIYIMKHDLSDEYKWFKLKKDKTISLQVDYMEKKLEPGENILLPDVVIGTHDGDWHEALTTYSQWVKSWYKPIATRKQWFREIFNFRQQFMHFELPRKSGMFNNENKEYKFREVIEKDIASFGGVDYLHIFDWGWSEQYGRCGDYDHWEQIGGSEAFRHAVEEIQEMGIPVGLYIEGYLVDPQSNIGKAHGEEWQMLGPDGKPYTYFAPSYNICSAVKEWQDYLSKVYARVYKETGVNGFYIDEMGFADPGHICYSPCHGHTIPEPPLRGQRDLVRKVREALPDDVVVYTEEIPTDMNSQYQDGSFTYAISSVSDELSPTHINLFRFAFPDFKTFEIITCDRPLGSDYQSVKRIFFNGEGIWIEGIADDWFSDETRKFISKMHKVIKRHIEAFTSMEPIPLVPVLVSDVYANQFPSEQETVWTLYNARYSTVRGELIAVPHKEGTKYYDSWNEKVLIPRISEGYAYLELELGPRDVGCIVQSYDTLKD